MENYKKIKELVELMRDFDLIEIELKDGKSEIKLKKGGRATEMQMMQFNPAAFSSMTNPIAPTPSVGSDAGSAQAPVGRDPNLREYKSPMVGTFYRAPSPESPPYVTEGDKINNESILCIIEAMKVMNEIKSDVAGEIAEILVENGEAVEFGQPLFLIRRAG